MSQPQAIPHTITYSGPCAGGALFIAGTFSRPEWLLQEMHRSATPSAASVTFSISVMVEPGREYQYRFKQGREGDWIVDEREPIVKSVLGTKSNLLRAPEPITPSHGRDSVSFTVPLFAHERLGSYTLSDGGSNVQDMTQGESAREISPRSFNAVPSDLSDPTLESFPCDKSSILGTLRKIQSSVGEQSAAAEGDRPTRRSSVDSDDGSSGSASPGAYRRREGRLSTSSNGRNRSLASLGSIAEEPSHKEQRHELRNIVESSMSDNGEALMMRASKRP